MSVPKYFDLNIGENVLIHLNIEDGLKEIISNSLDEHRIEQINKDIRIYKNDDDKWCIRDYGSGLKQNHFKFNINEDKENDDESIGMYGYGLKDAIGALFTKKIKFKIYTSKYIFKPIMQAKKDFPDIETLHIEVIKNKTYELKSGTEFVFDNLTLDSISKAKNKFIKFLKPDNLYQDSDLKIFDSDGKQSIYVNGVEVYNDSGFHFSYDIKSSSKIKECFNRDRKQLDLDLLKKEINKIWKKINFDDKKIKVNLLKKLKNILNTTSGEYLCEFNQKDVLRNIISYFNSTNSFVFVGKKEKLTKIIKVKIENDSKDILYLGDGVKQKFNVKNIKDLYHKDKFYKDYDESTPHILTLMNYIEPPKHINLEEYVCEIIKPIEKIFKLGENLRNKITKIEMIEMDEKNNEKCEGEDDENDKDDEDEDEDEEENSEDDDDEDNILLKYGYDFSGDKLKITKKYIEEKNKNDFFVILFRYIVNNIDDECIKKLNEDKKLDDKNSKGWFSWQ
jgi:hypothetical protein